MKKYYIYHIKGKKIGCTQNPKKRIKDQGFINYEILEEHTDIYLASDREIELQKEWGYKIDKVPYWKTIKMPTTESCRKGGNSNVINGTGYCNFKSRSKAGKIGGKICVQNGHMDMLHQNRKRPIIQMDKLGNYIAEFISIVEASIKLNTSASLIVKVCKGKRKTHSGFTFKYK